MISEKMEDLILEMKDTSELMVDLAYSAFLYDSEDIANEVMLLENGMDQLHKRVQDMAMKQGLEDKNSKKALFIINLVGAIERVADSAIEIADVVLRDIEPHPIFYMSLMESDTVITKVVAAKGSQLDDKSLGQIKLASETGMWVIAIKRGNRWIYGPDESTKLKAMDELFVRGPKEGLDSMHRLSSA